jgi:hypothetical protein
MAVSLDELIVAHQETLVDGIVKDAIRQIPSYGRAPLQQTVDRVESFLDAMAESVAQNDPDLLERHLVGVAQERKREGYAIMELHAMVHLAEEHLQETIRSAVTNEIEHDRLSALLEAVMDAARMVLSVRYLFSTRQS